MLSALHLPCRFPGQKFNLDRPTCEVGVQATAFRGLDTNFSTEYHLPGEYGVWIYNIQIRSANCRS